MRNTTGATPEEQWDALAREDPLWASCTHGKRHYKWQIDDFLATGEEELSWALQVAIAHDIEPRHRELALDFGCGPGRLIGALKARFERVVGVDVSPAMLAAAQRTHRGDGIHFTHSTSDLRSASVDLIYSSFVLQHLTQQGVEESIREFSRLLDPAGLLVFQYPLRPGFTLPGILYRVVPLELIERFKVQVLRYPAGMTMSWAGADRMRRLLGSAGLSVRVHLPGPQYTPHWQDAWYFATKQG